MISIYGILNHLTNQGPLPTILRSNKQKGLNLNNLMMMI